MLKQERKGLISYIVGVSRRCSPPGDYPDRFQRLGTSGFYRYQYVSVWVVHSTDCCRLGGLGLDRGWTSDTCLIFNMIWFLFPAAIQAAWSTGAAEAETTEATGAAAELPRKLRGNYQGYGKYRSRNYRGDGNYRGCWKWRETKALSRYLNIYLVVWRFPPFSRACLTMYKMSFYLSS